MTKLKSEETDHRDSNHVEIATNFEPIMSKPLKTRAPGESGIHANNIEFHCPLCRAEFKDVMSLSNHTQICDEKTTVAVFPQEEGQCSRSHPNPRNVEMHPVSHVNIGPEFEPFVTEPKYVETISKQVSSNACDEIDKSGQIECSVCEEKYDNITEYTHHLNMHLDTPAEPLVNMKEQFLDVPSPNLSVDVMIALRCMYCDWQHTCHSSSEATLAHMKHRQLCDPKKRKLHDGIIPWYIKQRLSSDQVNGSDIKGIDDMSVLMVQERKQKYRKRSAKKCKKISINAKNAKISCTLCKAVFSHENGLHQHMKWHKKHKPIAKCPYCPWQYTGDGSFRDAFREHRKSCGLHKKEQSSTDSIPTERIPINITSDKSRQMDVPMTVDEDSPNAESNRDEYPSKVIEINPFVCTLCNRTLSSGAASRQHMDMHERKWQLAKSVVEAMDGNDTKPSIQNSSKYPRVSLLDISTVSSFEIYLKINNNVGTIGTIQSVTEVKAHGHWVIGKERECNQTSHDVNNNNRDTCKSSISGQESTTKPKSISCAICLKQLNMDKIKVKLMPFTCTLCDKSFTLKGSLITHIETFHQKLKPFHHQECTLCKKLFASRDSLTMHIDAIHRKRTPFTCTLCNRSFTQKGNLNRHIDSVHHIHNRRFSCALCDKLFAEKRALTMHFAIVHNHDNK